VGDVIVVTGPPGAGKSTVAEPLARLLDPSALIAGDDFFASLRNGAISPWLKDADRQNAAVIEAAAAATGRLSRHCDVVYDGVVGPWFLRNFFAAAGLDRLHYVVLLPPLEVCLKRVETRPGHGFTDRDSARHMWLEFHDADVDRRHLFTDYDKQPADMARLLAQQLRTDGLLASADAVQSHPTSCEDCG
jgi:cytidylate kinase